MNKPDGNLARCGRQWYCRNPIRKPLFYGLRTSGPTQEYSNALECEVFSRSERIGLGMLSDPEIPGKRRSERVLITIPVQVSCYARDGISLKERGQTLVVTEHAALLSLPSRLEIDTLLEVMHCYSEEVGNFRVAHVDGEPKGGQFHIIAEMLTPGMDSGESDSRPKKASASH